MKKETLTFPDHESLWNFKDKTKAINIRIEPGKNRITGLFDPQEVTVALNEYQAITTSQNPAVDEGLKDRKNLQTAQKARYKLPWYKLAGATRLFLR